MNWNLFVGTLKTCLVKALPCPYDRKKQAALQQNVGSSTEACNTDKTEEEDGLTNEQEIEGVTTLTTSTTVSLRRL